MSPLLAASLFLVGNAVPLAEFTQADLEAIVHELDTVAPHQPDYAYPMAIRLVDKDVINAWTFVVQEGDRLVPQVELMTGLVKLAQGDKRILRAVLAHEMAHLALGHALQGFPHGDLELAHTRQQEFEADATGVAYLEALGYSRTDMVDAMHMLDADMKSDLQRTGASWLFAVAGSHASPLTRAARIAGDDTLLVAVTRFEIGLAYMDCRRYAAAIAFFDEARSSGWNMLEADLDAASAALQEYYDRLPGAVQEEWLRPEFGPHLTDVLLLRSRSIEITDEDQKRYSAALQRIEAAPAFFSAPMQPFLLATAHVLEPSGDEDTLRRGVSELEALLAGSALGSWDSEHLRLRVACNLALGLARLGEEERALRVLLSEQERDPTTYLPALAENLGRLPLGDMSQEQALLAAGVLYTFLSWTPVDEPGSRKVERALKKVVDEHDLQMESEPQRVPVGLCTVATMTIDGHEVGLFQPFTQVNAALESLPVAGTPNERYPELLWLAWGENELIGLTEREQLVKLTSYRPGSSLELRPQRDSGLRTTYSVRVGMTETELDALLRPAAGSAELQAEEVLLLGRRSFTAPPAESKESALGSDEDDTGSDEASAAPVEEETWRFYPQLDFGVLIEGGIVTGITVTPVNAP